MAALHAVFHTDSQRIHGDHQEMLRELAALDLALEHMASGSSDMPDSLCMSEARAVTLSLVRKLPEHCIHEESKLFAPISEVSDELAAFVEEMKREHVELFLMFNALCVAQDELVNAVDLGTAVVHLKDMGMEVSRALRHHITAEEHELQGFL